MSDCPKEQASQHPESPGIISDDETVCRGAFAPMHFNRSGVLKSNFVRPAHLVKGELSVWRLERDPTFDLAAIVDVLGAAPPPDNALSQVLGANVGAVRAFRMPDVFGEDQRIFCVLDDCRTDDEGGFHPEHATVTMEEIDGVEWAVGEDAFDTAKEGLAILLKSNLLWQAI